MRYVLVILGLLVCGQARAYDDLVLPKVEFAATAIHQAGAFQSKDRIHYADGKLRIDHGNGFSVTILDFTTQTQCLLMVNHTYLILPMDDELYRRYVARTADMSGARKIGTERMAGLDTTKYAFGDDGQLDAAGTYWLTGTGIMVRRAYDEGVFGRNVHHVEYLTDVVIEKQPAALFLIPAGYTRAK